MSAGGSHGSAKKGSHLQPLSSLPSLPPQPLPAPPIVGWLAMDLRPPGPDLVPSPRIFDLQMLRHLHARPVVSSDSGL